MDATMINGWAVVVSALSAFLLGGLWYSPLLFEKAWQKAANVSPESLGKRNMLIVFGMSFFWALIMAANLAFFLAGPTTTVLWGLSAGLLAGVGWVAAGFGIVGLFEGRGFAWFAINGGYLVVALAVMGLILGLWR